MVNALDYTETTPFAPGIQPIKQNKKKSNYFNLSYNSIRVYLLNQSLSLICQIIINRGGNLRWVVPHITYMSYTFNLKHF